MYQFIDSLKIHYQVIVISTRGHGKSELGTTALTFEQKANDVMTVINAVSKDSVTVLGFSDGAYTGFSLANRYPQKFKKLVAMGASELYPGLRDFSFDAKKAVSMDSAYWKQQFSFMPEPNKLSEMLHRLGDMYNHLTLTRDFFSTIKCPVLLIAGDRDPSNPVQREVNTAGMIRNCSLSIIPNCTHAMFLENFSAVWAVVQPFLSN